MNAAEAWKQLDVARKLEGSEKFFRLGALLFRLGLPVASGSFEEGVARAREGIVALAQSQRPSRW